jgi:putative SOS response-associated peptidase YedK
VPRFAKDPSIGARMINARGETLASRSAFRNAFARHRCLVPVNGFYEWHATPAGKQPLHIGMPDGRPFGLAGLYERWLSSGGDVLDTCAIVTTAATGSIAGMHDRMPVIVPDAEYARWLDPADADVADLVQGWTDPLRIYPVSARVNAVRNDDAALVEPMTLTAANDEAVTREPVPPRADASEKDLTREPVQEKLF